MMKPVAFVICILCIASVESRNSEDWPQFGHDTQHTFFSNSLVPRSLEIQWSYEVGSREEDRYTYTYLLQLWEYKHIYCLGQSSSNEAVVLVAGVACLILVAVLALRRTLS